MKERDKYIVNIQEERTRKTGNKIMRFQNENYENSRDKEVKKD